MVEFLGLVKKPNTFTRLNRKLYISGNVKSLSNQKKEKTKRRMFVVFSKEVVFESW